MARTTKQESDATAARILASARRLYAAEGFAAVSLEQIAADAGVTRGAVYHHYASRQGVFEAVHRWAQQEVAAEIERATDGITDAWQSLETGSRAFLAASVRDDIRRILLLDGPAVLGWNAWRELDAENSGQLLADVLGELRVASVPATQALLSGAMNEAALWAASQPDAAAAIDEAWPVLQTLLRSLRA